MPDGLLGVAWPSIRASFSIPLDSMGFLLTASVAGYLTSSTLSGPLSARLGVGRILAGSCAMTGMALVGYTIVPAWWMMVLLGVVSGLGAGAIDAALNAYVAVRFDERLMQWLHASYGIGVTLGPLIMTTALTALHSWRAGYVMVGGFQLTLAVCFLLTLPVWGGPDAGARGVESVHSTERRFSLGETLRHPRVWLSMLLFFLYTGAEVTLGAWSYTLLVESRGVAPGMAGLWAGGYWATFTAGRVAAGLYARRVGINLVVSGSLLAALLISLVLWCDFADLSNVAAVALTGLAIGPIFPGLMSGTSERVGSSFTTNTVGMQITAGGLGVAVIPSLVGVLARRISLEAIPVCLIVIFAALLALYAFVLKLGPRQPA